MMKLINGNCFEEMKNIETDKIDLILTDPPYEISDTNGGGIINHREFLNEIDDLNIANGFDVTSFLNETKKLFVNNKKYNAIYFCSRLQLHLYIKFAIDNELQYGILIWHKTNPAPLCNNKYLGDIEFIVYIKGTSAKIYGSYETKSLLYSSAINQSDKKLYKHPTIKPIDLIEKLLINHSLENDVVLDMFMGSGTTGVASTILKRNFIGIELDKKYFDIATKRIENKINVIEQGKKLQEFF